MESNSMKKKLKQMCAPGVRILEKIERCAALRRSALVYRWYCNVVGTEDGRI